MMSATEACQALSHLGRVEPHYSYTLDRSGTVTHPSNTPANHLDELFRYHTPTAEQVTAMQQVRDKARELAELMVANGPPSADLSAALRKLRESVMTFNAGVVLAP